MRLDLAEFEVTLNVKQWKAATVLGGSVLEALLLDELEKNKAAAQNATEAPKKHGAVVALNKWDLSHLLRVANELGVIDEQLLNLGLYARDFRNYIHPGVTVRKASRPTLGTAQAVKAAVQMTIEVLDARHKTKGSSNQ